MRVSTNARLFARNPRRLISDPAIAVIATRAAVTLAAVIVGVFALLAVSQVLTPGWWSQDTDAYWNAAMRLRDGQALYPALLNPDASDTYRYAPWFAFLWVPLTFVPQAIVYAAWTSVLLIAAGLCTLLVLRRTTVASLLLAMLFGSLLLPAAASGNVQPLLLIMLAWGVDRRAGPLWIAVGASLKAAPILLVAVYLGRGEWRRALLAGALTLALVAPMLTFDLSSYPTQAAAASGPLPLWIELVIAFVAALAALRFATTRYGWLTAALGLVFAIPRWSYYQPTFLLIGLAPKADATSRER